MQMKELSELRLNDIKILTLKDLEKLDTIEITKEELHLIKHWYSCNKEKIIRNYPFCEFIIKYQDNKLEESALLLHCKINKDNCISELSHYFYYPPKNVLILGIKFYDLVDGTYTSYVNSNFLTDSTQDIIKDSHNIYKEDIEEIQAIMEYSQLNQECVIRQTRTHTKKIQSKKDKRAGKKPKVKLIKQTIIRLNTDHIPEPTEEEKREYERHTLGWTVRGHWRHYKSGKDVWIKPQVRGDKDNIEGKTYEV